MVIQAHKAREACPEQMASTVSMEARANKVSQGFLVFLAERAQPVPPAFRALPGLLVSPDALEITALKASLVARAQRAYLVERETLATLELPALPDELVLKETLALKVRKAM